MNKKLRFGKSRSEGNIQFLAAADRQPLSKITKPLFPKLSKTRRKDSFPIPADRQLLVANVTGYHNRDLEPLGHRARIIGYRPRTLTAGRINREKRSRLAANPRLLAAGGCWHRSRHSMPAH